MTKYTVKLRLRGDRAEATVTPADIYDYQEGRIREIGRKIYEIQTEAENPVWARQIADERLSEYMREKL